MKYNTSIQTVPTNIVAGITNFKKRDMFEAPPEARVAPTVKF